MPAPVYIGDEVTAAGFRLAGARVRVCAPERADEELVAAMERATLILIGAAHAAEVPPKRLHAAVAGLSPVVLVVGDATGEHEMPDVGARVRRELGVEP